MATSTKHSGWKKTAGQTYVSALNLGIEGLRIVKSVTGCDIRILGDTPAANYILFDGSMPSLALAGSTALTVAGAVTGAATITSSGATSGVGYSAGAGGTVTQITSKATGVTLNKITGEIIMDAASLAAATSVGFTVTNSAVAATDVVVASIASAATAASYTLTVDAVAAGSFKLHLRNETTGALAEAVTINFAVIKAVKA